MYHKQTGSPDHTIAKIVTVPPLLGGCTTTRLRAMVLCFPINVIKESLTSVHFLCKIVVPVVLHMPSPEWAVCSKEGMTLVNLAPHDHALLVQIVTVILPVPLSLAQVAAWPGGASVVSVVDPITIALTTIVLALLSILESSAVMVPPLVLLVGAFYG
jgi:hypothetical protein